MRFCLVAGWMLCAALMGCGETGNPRVVAQKEPGFLQGPRDAFIVGTWVLKEASTSEPFAYRLEKFTVRNDSPLLVWESYGPLINPYGEGSHPICRFQGLTQIPYLASFSGGPDSDPAQPLSKFSLGFLNHSEKYSLLSGSGSDPGCDEELKRVQAAASSKPPTFPSENSIEPGVLIPIGGEFERIDDRTIRVSYPSDTRGEVWTLVFKKE